MGIATKDVTNDSRPANLPFTGRISKFNELRHPCLQATLRREQSADDTDTAYSMVLSHPRQRERLRNTLCLLQQDEYSRRQSGQAQYDVGV